MAKLEDACWEGYEAVGMKEKGGKMVPNCVPMASRVAARHMAKEWKKLPPGWTEESVRSFWETLTKSAPKHPVTKCIKDMEGKVSNPGAFCGGLADEMQPGWRSEAR